MLIQSLQKFRHVNYGILPYVWIASLKKDVYMATNVMSDMLRQNESPAKSLGKVMQKDHLHCWKSLYNWVVYLKLLIRENSTWTKKIGIKALQEHLAQNK